MAGKLNRKGKEPMSERVKRFTKTVRIGMKNNKIWIRTALLILSVMMSVTGVVYGFSHSKSVERERAMTVSDLSQEVAFSLTSTTLSLQPQRINGDTVVLPFTFNNMSNMSTDAESYHIFLKYSDGTPIDPSVVANIAVFGATKDGAVIIDGPLEQKPLQVAIRDDAELGAQRAEEGPFIFDGVEVPVDFNVASFTVNPRGENLTKDEDVAPDMSMENLYMAAVGDRLQKQLDNDRENLEADKEKSESLIEEYDYRLAQANEALGLSPTDREELEGDSSNGRYSSTEIELDEETLAEVGDASLATADMRALRSAVLSELNTEESNLEVANEGLESVDIREAELDEFINNVDSITSVGNSFELMAN